MRKKRGTGGLLLLLLRPVHQIGSRFYNSSQTLQQLLPRAPDQDNLLLLLLLLLLRCVGWILLFQTLVSLQVWVVGIWSS